MRIEVDLRACKAYANCIVEAPEVFDYSDATGKVQLLMDEVGADRYNEVRRAAAACPSHAISLQE